MMEVMLDGSYRTTKQLVKWSAFITRDVQQANIFQQFDMPIS
jgi:hypothetical protein